MTMGGNKEETKDDAKKAGPIIKNTVDVRVVEKMVEARDFKSSRNRLLRSRYDRGRVLEYESY